MALVSREVSLLLFLKGKTKQDEWNKIRWILRLDVKETKSNLFGGRRQMQWWKWKVKEMKFVIKVSPKIARKNTRSKNLEYISPSTLKINVQGFVSILIVNIPKNFKTITSLSFYSHFYSQRLLLWSWWLINDNKAT